MTIGLRLVLDQEGIAEAIGEVLATQPLTALGAVRLALEHWIVGDIAASLPVPLIKPTLVRIGSFRPNGYVPLAALADEGLEVFYTEITCSAPPSEDAKEVSVETVGFGLDECFFGPDHREAWRLKVRPLKRRTDYQIRLHRMQLPREVFVRVVERQAGRPLLRPLMPNPQPGIEIDQYASYFDGYRLVSFDHVVTGERWFCACASEAHHQLRAQAEQALPEYHAPAWPHRITALMKEARYAPGLCHLCLAAEQGPAAAATHYGLGIEGFQAAYMDQLMAGAGLDRRTARAEVQQRLGLSRWRREAELFRIVKALFPGEVVQREASPPWLGRQRLDIYVPGRRLAIEHHGEQHFTPIAVFGGAEGLERATQRDAQKQRLCEENGVALVQVAHGEALTEPALRQRLRRFLAD